MVISIEEIKDCRCIKNLTSFPYQGRKQVSKNTAQAGERAKGIGDRKGSTGCRSCFIPCFLEDLFD
uniref:Uncharacterized protein n=1 Tax=Cucumis melo TaxID=3656 RepID=A0A9I9ELI4_CUCME